MYNGMTPVVKTGLLFVYPVYLWILMIVFIIFSHYSTRVSNRTAMHSVQVLATLMYLSFSKILMIVIDIIAYIPVHTSRNGTMIVWYGDGSVPLCLSFRRASYSFSPISGKPVVVYFTFHLVCHIWWVLYQVDLCQYVSETILGSISRSIQAEERLLVWC